MDFSKLIENNRLLVQVKPNSKKTEVIGFDYTSKMLIVAVKAPAEDNKANIELVKFLSRQLKKQVRIKKGLTNKRKTLEIQ
ncbi:YggU family protein [Candidatus Woesearchaeota archaeon]|nr:YggU family protein [Candidatus Woesearchaeota archaeon]